MLAKLPPQKLRKGTYFPSFLEPRRLAEKALTSLSQEAYVQGVSTRAADDLIKAMGGSGVSKSQVSRLREEIGERVRRLLDRPLVGAWPNLWIDATFVKVRQNGRIVSVAVIADGRREILGMDIGPSEAETFWIGFLRKLRRRACAASSSSSPTRIHDCPVHVELQISESSRESSGGGFWNCFRRVKSFRCVRLVRTPATSRE